MAQPFYRPPFRQQLTGSALGPFNCNMASAAMMANRDTLGAVNVTPDAMRKASGDTSGGTSQGGAQTALAKYGVIVKSYDGYDGYTWAEFNADLKRGQAVMVAGDYDSLPYALKGSKEFNGDHRVFVQEILAGGDFYVYDPISDGRRPGIPKSPLHWSPTVMHKYVSDRSNTGLSGPSTNIWALVMVRRRVTPKTPTANIRSGAAMSYPIIATLKRGAYLARGSKAQIGNVAGDDQSRVWYRVWVPSIAKVGYVHSSVVTLV